VSTSGPSRTTRPRRSRASTANGTIVSSTEVAAGSRTGMPVSGSDMGLYMDLRGALCEPSRDATRHAMQNRAPAQSGSVPTYAESGTTRHSADPNLACEAPGQDALLGMQPVLRLVEYHRLRAIDHVVRDLLAAVGGQAVHEDRVRLG